MIFSEALRVGRARHWRDVIRMLTRGQTDRVSSEPILNYFQPLFLWLKVQNKDETTLGWTTKMEDTMLFQPLFSSGSLVYTNIKVTIVFLFVMLLH